MVISATQTLFSEALLASGKESADKLSQLETLVRNTGGLSPHERISIYKSTGLSAKIAVLKQIYPVCEKILGARAFQHVAQAYADSYPSLHFDLNLYGDHFAHFIDGVEQLNDAGGLEYLKDLCLLEYYWHTAYYQDNDPAFDFMEFSKVCDKPYNLVLDLSHSLQLMSSEYPIEEIWRGHQQNETLSSIKGLQDRSFLCVFRDGFSVTVQAISPSYHDFLQACMQGVVLGDIAENPELADVLADLPLMIEKAWVSGFHVLPKR